MKVFIAGARSITTLNAPVQKRMMSIYEKGYSVLVGDCYGVDASVQRFYANLGYQNVCVYASGGRARNNVGHWAIKSVSASPGARGFDFYKQKDLAMANEADYGFMIWDGESRGTLNNIINLVLQNKSVLLYLAPVNQMLVVKTLGDCSKVVSLCMPKTQAIYGQLLQAAAPVQVP